MKLKGKRTWQQHCDTRSFPTPPRSEAELLRRAQAIAGYALAALAPRAAATVPADPRRAKGWTGQLIESILGASAASRSEPDFPLIGVELKTLPVSVDGRPTESTYVCTVPLLEHHGLTWEQSCVYRKLKRVLWFPVEGAPSVPMGNRRLGFPLLWSPSTQEERVLCTDWEELMEMIVLGQVESLTAHQGSYLQVRPKAANARARRLGIDNNGARVPILPRGFYLRTRFTGAILRRHFVLPK
ncbi:MAG: DNA mismatch repair endonuclease MutH [Gammaproteobacteria bacterium]|jgi:DNA mismatch repair protein MutH